VFGVPTTFEMMRDEPGFAYEIITEFPDSGKLLPDQFDGDFLGKLSRTPLDGFVNDTHSTFSNGPGNFVVKLVKDVL